MIKVVSVSQMQLIEQEANTFGLTYEMMMENAGRGLAELVMDRYSYLSQRGALGLAGSGNNGGDTLVALSHLAAAGWDTSAVIVRPRPSNDPLISRLVEAGGKIYHCQNKSELNDIVGLLNRYSLLLDGILGTGFHLPLRGDLASIIEDIRRQVIESKDPPNVIAVDCPSGIDCDSGEAAEECIPANHTITMAAVKQGLLRFPAYGLVGELDVVGIGLPNGGEGLQSWRQVQTFLIDRNWVSRVLPERPLDAHKGTFGTALIVAGSANYTGAVLLAGKAAYLIGSGLVTLAVPAFLHAALAGQLPEATWLLLPDENGAIAGSAAGMLRDDLSRADALLVGCGFGLADTSRDFIAKLVEGKNIPPLVIDADGLKLLGTLESWHQRIPDGSVLTPHPGEMALLTGLTINEIQVNRLEIARTYSQLWGHVVVLKGAFTIIAEPKGQSSIIPVASPALARAGTGDVLAGLIAGLMAQGVNAYQAAAAGAWIHAHAGLEAAARLGTTTSVLASDLLHSTVQVLADLNSIQ